MSYFTRYCEGEQEAVWTELTVLGEAVRSPEVLEDARAVATETMRRVYHNLQILEARLPACGYRFNAPTLEPPCSVLRAATPADHALLRVLEHENGPLPLSLHAFYTVIGEVNFAQDYDQLVQWPEREDGAPYTELEILGEYQPLVISPLAFLRKRRQLQSGRVAVPLLPDEAATAFYSGDYYYTWLPQPHADASFEPCALQQEMFVDYLRQAFRHGGFHGRPSEAQTKKEKAWLFPSLPCLTAIAQKLLPI